MVFISSDKLHKKCASPFLRKDQDFVWGTDLKSELTRQNAEFLKLPQDVLETGLMKFARSPLGEEGNLLKTLWDRHTPGWRSRDENSIPLTPEAEMLLVDKMKSFIEAPTVVRSEMANEADLEQLSIQRLVPKRKGSWWLLPKDFKVSDYDVPSGV